MKEGLESFFEQNTKSYLEVFTVDNAFENDVQSETDMESEKY